MHRTPFSFPWGRLTVGRHVGVYAKGSSSTVSLDHPSQGPQPAGPLGLSSTPTLPTSPNRPRTISSFAADPMSLSWRRGPTATLVQARMNPRGVSSSSASPYSTTSPPISFEPTSSSAVATENLPLPETTLSPPPGFAPPETARTAKSVVTAKRVVSAPTVESLTEDMLQSKRRNRLADVVRGYEKIRVMTEGMVPLLAYNILFDAYGHTIKNSHRIQSIAGDNNKATEPSIEGLLIAYGDLSRATHISPSAFTYACLLKAFSMYSRNHSRSLRISAANHTGTEKGELDALMTSISTDLGGAASLPHASSTLVGQIYDEMHRKGLMADISLPIHNQVLRSAADAKDLKLALRVFAALESSPTLEPNEFTYSALILALGIAGEYDAARACFTTFLASAPASSTPLTLDAKILVANHLVDALSQPGADLDAVRRLIDHDLPKEHIDVGVVGLNTLITAYGNDHQIHKAHALVQAMADPSSPYPPPDIITLRALLSAAVRLADAPVINWTWKELTTRFPDLWDIKKDISPNTRAHILSYPRLVHLLKITLMADDTAVSVDVLRGLFSPSLLHPIPESSIDKRVGISTELAHYLSRPHRTGEEIATILRIISPLIQPLPAPAKEHVLGWIQKSTVKSAPMAMADPTAVSETAVDNTIPLSRLLVTFVWMRHWPQFVETSFTSALGAQLIAFLQAHSEDPAALSPLLVDLSFSPTLMSALMESQIALFSKDDWACPEAISRLRLLLHGALASEYAPPRLWWDKAVTGPARVAGLDEPALQALREMYVTEAAAIPRTTVSAPSTPIAPSTTSSPDASRTAITLGQEWGNGQSLNKNKAHILLAMDDVAEAARIGLEALCVASKHRARNNAQARYSRSPPPSPPSTFFINVLLGRISHTSAAIPCDPKVVRDAGRHAIATIDSLAQWPRFRPFAVTHATFITICMRKGADSEMIRRAKAFYDTALADHRLSADTSFQSLFGAMAQGLLTQGRPREELVKVLTDWEERKGDLLPNRNIVRLSVITNTLFPSRDLLAARATIEANEELHGGSLLESWVNLCAGMILDGQAAEAADLWKWVQARPADYIGDEAIKVALRTPDPWIQVHDVLASIYGPESPEDAAIHHARETFLSKAPAL